MSASPDPPVLRKTSTVSTQFSIEPGSMHPTISVASFYGQDKYSDVTVKFGDREVKCHKFVLCERSKYFDKLCGPGSKFEEGSKGVIELKGDDPDAVEALLRYIYTGNYTACQRWHDPSFHLHVSIAADKYDFPFLSKDADITFKRKAKEVSDFTQVINIMDALADLGQDGVFAEELRKQNLAGLIKDPAYRERLSNNEQLMWQHFDELAFGAELVEKHVALCRLHRDKVLTDPETVNCVMCTQSVPSSAHTARQSGGLFSLSQSTQPSTRAVSPTGGPQATASGRSGSRSSFPVHDSGLFGTSTFGNFGSGAGTSTSNSLRRTTGRREAEGISCWIKKT